MLSEPAQLVQDCVSTLAVDGLLGTAGPASSGQTSTLKELSWCSGWGPLLGAVGAYITGTKLPCEGLKCQDLPHWGSLAGGGLLAAPESAHRRALDADVLLPLECAPQQAAHPSVCAARLACHSPTTCATSKYRGG